MVRRMLVNHRYLPSLASIASSKQSTSIDVAMLTSVCFSCERLNRVVQFGHTNSRCSIEASMISRPPRLASVYKNTAWRSRARRRAGRPGRELAHTGESLPVGDEPLHQFFPPAAGLQSKPRCSTRAMEQRVAQHASGPRSPLRQLRSTLSLPRVAGRGDLQRMIPPMPRTNDSPSPKTPTCATLGK